MQASEGVREAAIMLTSFFSNTDILSLYTSVRPHPENAGQFWLPLHAKNIIF